MNVVPAIALAFLFLPPALASPLQKITVSHFSSQPLQLQTQVWASVGDYLYDIDGYTTPGAKIRLVSSQRTLEATTISDSRGHFAFYHLLSRRRPGMFCFFQSYQSQTSPPLCLWPPPGGRHRHLQGVFLPPIVSLQLSQRPGQFTYLLGRTIPNSQISLLKFQNHHWWQLLPPKIAVSWARQNIQADGQGRFYIPLGKTGRGQVMVGSRFRQSLTPPSYNLSWRGWNIFVWIRQQANQICHYLCRWLSFWLLQLLVIVYLYFHAQRQPD